MLKKVQKATKLIPNFEEIVYIDRFKLLKLPQARRNMIEMYKILSGKYDTVVTLGVTRKHSHITRGNHLRLEKIRSKYDLRKYFFTNRVVSTWNSLPKDVVLCDTINKFKSHLDKYWQYQDIVYDYKAEIHGTGSRSSHY